MKAIGQKTLSWKLILCRLSFSQLLHEVTWFCLYKKYDLMQIYVRGNCLYAFLKKWIAAKTEEDQKSAATLAALCGCT